ncbi:MAG: ATP-binding cassette domain-containing protein [Actinomycetota bacterium]|nr:ATP-binding cassette domain-containing protein [Actinomycetota bacterium]
MIEARGLTKRYGSTLAVDDLSFDVLPGRVTGFLGPNGAGKSTTMRMILGLDRPTSGTVTVLGRRFDEHYRPLHEIGAVLESRSVHGGRSAYHHLLCLAQSNGIDRRRVRTVLDLVGLSDVAGRRAGAFSLGMSQRLGLAAALLGDPAVVLCDEPVNGLDPEGIRWIRTTLRALAAEGRTVFVSSHLMSEMALMADHLIVVGRGRLLADAGVDELLSGAARSFALVRTPDEARLEPVLRAAGGTTRPHAEGGIEVIGLPCAQIGDLAAEHGLRVHELTLRQASLEAAFLELTHDSVDFRVEEAS